MTESLNLIKKYSIKHRDIITKITAPLSDYLDTPVFTYCFIEKDGRFGYLTNAIEFNEYYFSQKIHLQNPYFSNPSFFHSGHALLPCTYDEGAQKSLSKRFCSDHLFLQLHANESLMEFFIFANENVKATDAHHYLLRLDLFNKFIRYFRREAGELIGKMKADGFNMKMERGLELFENAPTVPLALDPQFCSFLKRISILSPQERRCLDLFKQGKSAQATGAIMGLSQRTVEHYFDNIKNKLECSSKYDLLNF